MTLLKMQKILFVLFFLAMGLSAFALGFFGLNLGIDFTGGSLLEAEYSSLRPGTEEIRGSLQNLDLGSFSVQQTRERGVLLRMKNIPETAHQQVLSALGEGVTELRFESIGPVIGQELRSKAFLLVALSLLVVVLYIAFAFRRTAASIRPWHWSGAVLTAALHDILVPLGAFAVLGFVFEVQFTLPVVVALLTVVGYSINDTVVVFDRIRENMFSRAGLGFPDIVRRSLQQTWARSLSTSLTTLAVLCSIYFFGGSTLKDFSFMLIVGIAAGTFSSLFLAPSLLLLWRKQLFGL